jgi:hypothetical protein
MYVCPYVTCLSCLSDFNKRILKIPHLVAVRLFHDDSRTDRHDDLTPAFGYFFMCALGN